MRTGGAREKLGLLLVYSWVAMSCTVSGGPDMLHVDENFDTREVVLRQRQLLELTFGENPTTGFRWELTDNGAPVCALRDSSFDPPTGGLGKGGARRWRFETVQAGTGRIALVYRRGWEDKAPARTFQITVRVEP